MRVDRIRVLRPGGQNLYEKRMSVFSNILASSDMPGKFPGGRIDYASAFSSAADTVTEIVSVLPL